MANLLESTARIRIHFGRLDPVPHWEYGPGSGFRRAKMTHKSEENASFLSGRCFLLKGEDFSWSLNVLYGGLGISKLQFLIKKIKINFQL